MSKGEEYEPKILAFLCNRFFLWAFFCAGRPSQRNHGKSKISRGLEKPQFFIGKWVKKKLGSTCSKKGGALSA